MADLGHNGGPPLLTLTPKSKIECVRAILMRSDLTSAQKCVGVSLIVVADKDWSAEASTEDLKRMASAKDKETVFRATKALVDKKVIAKTSARGQSGKFAILPPSIVEAIVEAYEDAKSGRDEADHSRQKQSGETGRHTQSVPTPQAVGMVPTTPDQSAQTGPVSPDHSSRAVKNNNNIIYNNINNLNKSTTTNQEPAREGLPQTRDEYQALTDKLLEACNGSLDNPANCQGLLNLATPLMWLREGCDLDADIIPALRGMGTAAHGRRITTWNYFTNGIRRARDTRVCGLPPPGPVAPAGKARGSRQVPLPEGKSFMDMTKEMLAKIEKGEL